jgi:hypothetical protein
VERIGGETMVLYGDLRERLETFESMRSVASLPGEFTRKEIKGRVYHYFQATLASGRAQIYIGPDGDETRRLISAREAGGKAVQADVEMFQRLGAQLIAGGVTPVPTGMARVIARLADSGVFRVGGVLVGGIAYHVLGTHLGMNWDARVRMTQDLDVAGGDVDLAVPDAQAEVPAAMESLKMGFFPVPRLSRKEPSTSYAIRGKTLRVDLLTSGRGDEGAPVFLRRLNAAARPLRFLGYLMESPLSAVMVGGTPCLVKVPQPARFALHKLLISRERDASSSDKRRKDVEQARSLIRPAWPRYPLSGGGFPPGRPVPGSFSRRERSSMAGAA